MNIRLKEKRGIRMSNNKKQKIFVKIFALVLALMMVLSVAISLIYMLIGK